MDVDARQIPLDLQAFSRDLDSLYNELEVGLANQPTIADMLHVLNTIVHMRASLPAINNPIVNHVVAKSALVLSMLFNLIITSSAPRPLEVLNIVDETGLFVNLTLNDKA